MEGRREMEAGMDGWRDGWPGIKNRSMEADMDVGRSKGRREGAS